MDVRLPDGTVIQNVPEGTTKAQLVAKLAAKGYDVSWYKPEAPKQKETDYAKTAEEMPWYEQMAAGAGGAITGMGLGLRQILPFVDKPSEEEVKEYQRAMQGLRGTGAGFTGEILGNIVPGLGLMRGVSAVPAVASRLAAGGMPAAKTIAATGGAIGATEGALTPVTEDQSRAANVAIQGTLGAVAPAVVGGVTKTVQSAKNAVAPFFSKEAQQTAAGQMIRDVTGDRADDVIAAMKSATPMQQRVASALGQPAAAPTKTAGQAAVDLDLPEFAALQRKAFDYAPDKPFAVEMAQREARQAQLKSFGKTPVELEAAISARDLAATQNYAKAFANRVKGDAELGQLLKNPYIKDTLNDVRKLVQSRQSRGETVPLGEQLQMIKKQLDYAMAGTPVNKPSTDAIREIADTQVRLTDWMKKNIQGYEKALDDYASASKDITEMKIGQKASDILASNIGAKERGAQLARVVDDEIALLKQSGGFTKKQLAEQLKPENMAKLQKVVDELDIDSRFQEQASRGMKGERVSSAVGTGIELPHFLNNAVVLMNNAIRKFAGGGQDRSLKELAEILTDPAQTAKVMEKASKKEQNAIRFLVRAQQTGAIVSPAVMETAE